MGFNLIGLQEATAKLFNGSRSIPWGIQAKAKDKLLKPGKAPAAKKKHRLMVQASRKRNT